MKIFLSWSGPASHSVALALRGWLPTVLPQVRGWVSSEDIPKGRRWARVLDDQLQGTNFCVVCIVPGNLTEPWINFEAGAIAREVDQSNVTPFLVGLGVEALERSPLSLFQATRFEREDVKRLLVSINEASGAPVSLDALSKGFAQRWPKLEAELKQIDVGTTVEPGALSGGDDEEEDDSFFLDEDQEKVLVLLGEVDRPVNAQALATHLGERALRVDYWLDQLLARRLVLDHLSVGEPPAFTVSPQGRAYLVENDLI